MLYCLVIGQAQDPRYLVEGGSDKNPVTLNKMEIFEYL